MKWILAIMMLTVSACGQEEESSMPVAFQKCTLGRGNGSYLFDGVVGGAASSVFGSASHYRGSFVGDGTVYATQTYSTKYDWWTQPCTMSVWVHIKTGVNLSTPFTFGNMKPDAADNYWSIFERTPSDVVNPSFYYYSGSANSIVYNYINPLSTWTHLAATFNPVTKDILYYVNGNYTPAYSGTSSWSGKTPQSGTSAPLTIGASNTKKFIGRIYKLTIYRAILSHAQIRQIASERPLP